MEVSGFSSVNLLVSVLGKADGKADGGSTSTISAAAVEESASISTNGKADGKADGIGSIVDVSA